MSATVLTSLSVLPWGQRFTPLRFAPIADFELLVLASSRAKTANLDKSTSVAPSPYVCGGAHLLIQRMYVWYFYEVLLLHILQFIYTYEIFICVLNIVNSGQRCNRVLHHG